MTNHKTTLFLFIFFFVTTFGSKLTYASSSIDGSWKHASKPAFIEFNLKTGIASVKEHKTYKENTGLTVIKNIVPSSIAENEWQGLMYDGYQDKYVSVTIRRDGQSISVFDIQNNEVLKLVKE